MGTFIADDAKAINARMQEIDAAEHAHLKSEVTKTVLKPKKQSTNVKIKTPYCPACAVSLKKTDGRFYCPNCAAAWAYSGDPISDDK